MNLENKNASETIESLLGKTKEELQAICDENQIEYHPRNNENSLRDMIIKAVQKDLLPKTDNLAKVEDTEKLSLAEARNLEMVGIKNEVNLETGIVELILDNPKKTGGLMVRNYTGKDGKVKHLVDINGDPWAYRITKKARLDLSNSEDLKLYKHLLEHPYVIGGNGITKSITLKHEGQESMSFIEKKELIHKADSIIMAMNELELRSFARLLNVQNAHKKAILTVKTQCFKQCEENPKRVLEAYTDQDKELKSLVYLAIDTGLISKTDDLFKYESRSIGISFDAVVMFFKDNEDLVPRLRQLVK